MAKSKIVYYCQSCGAESAKWMGQCPACKEWNTFVEEALPIKRAANSVPGQAHRVKVTKIKEIEAAVE